MKLLNILFFVCFSVSVMGQDSLHFFDPARQPVKSRRIITTGTQLIAWSGSMLALGNLWYKDYSTVGMHSFDDNAEWMQMDKAGHVLAAWYLGRQASAINRWSGLEAHRSALLGAAYGFAFLGGIELMDGFSSGWGFSFGDMAANVIGGGFGYLQDRLSEKENKAARIIRTAQLKFSFTQSPYYVYRPELLGKSLSENIFKDYNGQTYWLSLNLSSFCNSESKFPMWINLAFGYGADGMISGRPGYEYTNAQGNEVEFVRYRQFYISPDIDLSRIKVRSKALHSFLRLISVVKFPFPAFEVNSGNATFHPFFF